MEVLLLTGFPAVLRGSILLTSDDGNILLYSTTLNVSNVMPLMGAESTFSLLLMLVCLWVIV